MTGKLKREFNRLQAGKGTTMTITNYDERVLLDMAQEYLTAENEYRLFLLTYKGG